MIETGLVYLIRLCLILPYIEQNRILLLETDWKKNGIPIGFGIFFFFAIKTLANAVSGHNNELNLVIGYFYDH